MNRIPRLKLGGIEINELKDAAAMGLPDHYLGSDLDRLENMFLSQFSDQDQLINIIESTESSFIERFVAGQVLALIGDERISPEFPKMIEIPEWEGKLGLDSSQLDSIVSEYSHLGVKKEWIEKETPQYNVHIPSYKIAKYPVTNFEYMLFLNDTKSEKLPSSWQFNNYPFHFANHPVFSLSVDACYDYIDWLSDNTGRSFRLPTEAEWEHASGGPNCLEFPWGNEFRKDCCNTLESGILMTTPIGCFPKGASDFGCLDMAGNVEEYVSDAYQSYNECAVVEDDLIQFNGAYNVTRGGSFARFRDLARTRRRHGPYPKKIYTLGFRLAESI